MQNAQKTQNAIYQFKGALEKGSSLVLSQQQQQQQQGLRDVGSRWSVIVPARVRELFSVGLPLAAIRSARQGAARGAVLGAVSLAVLGTGCSSVHSPHPEHASHGKARPGMAMMCDRCETTWVVRPEGTGRLVRYTRQRAMVCPECQSAVETWWKTGVFKHSCSRCQGKLTCESPKGS